MRASHPPELDDTPERWVAQLRKGSLELAALASLCGGRRYGLEILRALSASPALALTEGTLYPMLSRLKREGLLSSEWVESEAGHPRKYYSLTASGRQRLRAMALRWDQFASGMSFMLAPVLEQEMEKAS